MSTHPRRRTTDPVNPSHYHGDYVMRVIEDFQLDFLSGTIVKYLLRAGNKPGDSILQDLKKAHWYLERKIAALSKSTDPQAIDRTNLKELPPDAARKAVK